MAATNFCNDHISQNSFLRRFKPDYFVTGRINQNNAVKTLYIELIDAKNLFLIASNHLPVDELHNTSQFIIDNILQTVHNPERSVRLAKPTKVTRIIIYQMNCWLVRKNFTSLHLKAFTGL